MKYAATGAIKKMPVATTRAPVGPSLFSRTIAGKKTRFLGRQPDDVVNDYASRCRALIFPGEEDFGMTPLEINAAGRPVIAFRGGGATETVIENETGVFFDRQTPESLAAAIENFETMVKAKQKIIDAGQDENLISEFYKLPENIDTIEKVKSISKMLSDPEQAETVISEWIEYFNQKYQTIIFLYVLIRQV